MKSEEIKKGAHDCPTAYWIKEVAFQLAILNETIDKIVTAKIQIKVKPLYDHGG